MDSRFAGRPMAAAEKILLVLERPQVFSWKPVDIAGHGLSDSADYRGVQHTVAQALMLAPPMPLGNRAAARYLDGSASA